MSTSVSRRSSATGHPTRQQLDELDALLKRMLDLPVNRDESEAAPPAAAAPETPAQPKADGPEPMRGPHRPTVERQTPTPAVNYSTTEEDEANLKPRVVPNQPTDRPEGWAPLTSTWQPSARTWKPLSDAWNQAKKTADPSEEPATVAAPPSPASVPVISSAPEPTVEAAPPTPELAAESTSPPMRAGASRWMLWPLLGFNAAFDACLVPWGAPGRWMRGRKGRMFLGVVGLLALAAAAAFLLADWFGWTG